MSDKIYTSSFTGPQIDEAVRYVLNGVTDSCINVTYEYLLDLRNTQQLVPGQQYRITDYVTTAYQCNEDGAATSAGHQFDLIVTATDVNTLSERAKAVLHDGDTYFAKSDLAAWDIWYDLDNDRNKYGWACDGSHVSINRIYIKHEWLDYFENYHEYSDSQVGYVYEFIENNVNKNIYIEDGNPIVGVEYYCYGNWTEDDTERQVMLDAVLKVEEDLPVGKGVIYRMIDEFGNDCPYDFKNIVFKRYILGPAAQYNTDSNWSVPALENVKLDSDKMYLRPEITLSGIYAGFKNMLDYSNNPIAKYLKLQSYDSSVNTYTFSYSDSEMVSTDTADASLTGYCRFNTMGPRFANDKLQLNNNVFFVHKIIGDDAIEPQQYYCYSNKLGDNCHRNTFGAYCFSITLGNSCRDNIFGNQTYSMTLGNYCRYNYFGTECNSNILGNYANSNIFGNKSYSNQFGSFAKFNVSGKYCRYNVFGNAHTYNIMRDYFTGNKFGNYCSGTYFGDSFRYNTFGNNVTNVKIISNTSYSQYFQNNKFENGVHDVLIRGNNKGNSTNFVQNYIFSTGFTYPSNGDNNIRIELYRNTSKEQVLSLNSNNELKCYCLADLF